LSIRRSGGQHHSSRSRDPGVQVTELPESPMGAGCNETGTLVAACRGWRALHRSVCMPERPDLGVLSTSHRNTSLTQGGRDGLAAGQSLRAIASALGRSPSTISREVTGNGGPRRYRATVADQAAWARSTRPKTCKLAMNAVLAGIVTEKLHRRWSPQQIAGWL